MEWSAKHGGYFDSNEPEKPQRHWGPRAGLIRAVMFFAAFAVLQLGWNALHGSAVERLIVHDGTVRPAAWLVNFFTPSVQARAVDFSLRAPGGGLNILNGCEGMDALLLLICAFLVAPVSWRTRLPGLLAGIPVVFVVNQARILTLFYAYRSDHSLFEPLHGIIAPIAIVLIVSCYFYAWLAHAARRPAPSA